MKKRGIWRIIAMLLVAVLLVAVLLTGCSSEQRKTETAATGQDSQAQAENSGSAAETTEAKTQDATADTAAATDTAAVAETAPASDSDTSAVAQIAAKAAEKKAEPAEHVLILPARFIMPYAGGGTVELITYTAHDYKNGVKEDTEKRAYVYLPEGYDESKQYNVLYLMHGIGGDEKEWTLDKKQDSKIKRMMDNLAANGDIEPFIVVTPNGRATACSEGNDAFYDYAYELRNDLIPYIESHYSTYAEYSEDGYDLTATRTHRAMAGLSMGGMQTINVGICECLDIMSWFGAFSAAPTSYNASKVAASIDASEYTVDFFYNICGTDDNIAYGSHAAAAKNVCALTDKLEDGVNYMWQEKKGGHDFNIWNLGFFNFALEVFKEK